MTQRFYSIIWHRNQVDETNEEWTVIKLTPLPMQVEELTALLRINNSIHGGVP